MGYLEKEKLFKILVKLTTQDKLVWETVGDSFDDTFTVKLGQWKIIISANRYLLNIRNIRNKTETSIIYPSELVLHRLCQAIKSQQKRRGEVYEDMSPQEELKFFKKFQNLLERYPI